MRFICWGIMIKIIYCYIIIELNGDRTLLLLLFREQMTQDSSIYRFIFLALLFRDIIDFNYSLLPENNFDILLIE